MEEADILADRKCIMTAGTIRCVGTSLYLKSKFGIGYYLEVEVFSKINLAKTGLNLLQFIQHFVPSASRHVDHSKGSALAMAAAKKNLLLFSLPLSAITSFSDLFAHLELQKVQLGVVRYGVSLSTLEEVFFKLGDVELEAQVIKEEAGDHRIELEPIGDIVTKRRSSVLPFNPMTEPSGRRLSQMRSSLIEPIEDEISKP